MGPSLRLIKIFGIPVEINFSWIFIFLLVTYLLGSQFGHTHPGWPVAQQWGLAVTTSALFFLSVLAHELSHSLVAVRRGIPVLSITLFFFGGVSQLSHEARRPYTEFVVTVVGPLSSILLALVFGGLWYLLRPYSESLEVVFRLLMTINLMLGVFNMLPGFPLDGGRMLRAAIWGITGNFWRATQVAARIGQAFGVLMVLGGVSLAVLDFALFGVSGIWMALIGGFLFSAATASYRQGRAREGLKSFRVSDVLTDDWWTLPGDMPLGSPLVGQRLARQNDVVMVSLNGRVEGLLTRRLFDSVPRSQWPFTPLSRVMMPLGSMPWLAPEDTMSDALERVESSRIDRLAVRNAAGGELLGVVSREDILRFARRVLHIKL
ncbi:MAG: site-2 protease family protein [Chloroflexi bacterium]|nr:site-2 protease family protein [Chloroflexota bacterium]